MEWEGEYDVENKKDHPRPKSLLTSATLTEATIKIKKRGEKRAKPSLLIKPSLSIPKRLWKEGRPGRRDKGGENIAPFNIWEFRKKSFYRLPTPTWDE